MGADSRVITELDEVECWRLLGGKSIGRLAVAIKGQPDIFPVNYGVLDRQLIVRTNPGLKLAASTLGRGVAFEVDDLDEDNHLGSSVVVKGMAEEIERVEDVLDANDLLIEPWDPTGKSRFVRITPTTVSGRRFVVPTSGGSPEHGGN